MIYLDATEFLMFSYILKEALKQTSVCTEDFPSAV